MNDDQHNSRARGATKRKNAARSPGEAALDELTPRQRVFVAEFLRTWHGTLSAKKAGYGCPAVAASQMLRKTKIRAAFERGFQAVRLTADMALARLAEMANANITDFVQEDGTLNKAAFRQKGYLIKSIKVRADGRVAEIELHDALAALVMIGRHLGLFDKRASGVVALPSRLETGTPVGSWTLFCFARRE